MSGFEPGLCDGTRRCSICGTDRRDIAFVWVIAPTPDPMTFLSLGAPVILLYEACIWIVWLMDRRKKNRDDKDKLN